MKKGFSMTSLKIKRKAVHPVVRHDSSASISKKSKMMLGGATVAIHIHIVRHPVLQGIGSLGNISGGYVRFNKYMRENYVCDMKRDWERVGECLNESMKAIR